MARITRSGPGLEPKVQPAELPTKCTELLDHRTPKCQKILNLVNVCAFWSLTAQLHVRPKITDFLV